MTVIRAERVLQERLEGSRVLVLDIMQHGVLLVARQGGEATRAPAPSEHLDPLQSFEKDASRIRRRSRHPVEVRDEPEVTGRRKGATGGHEPIQHEAEQLGLGRREDSRGHRFRALRLR